MTTEKQLWISNPAHQHYHKAVRIISMLSDGYTVVLTQNEVNNLETLDRPYNPVEEEPFKVGLHDISDDFM